MGAPRQLVISICHNTGQTPARSFRSAGLHRTRYKKDLVRTMFFVEVINNSRPVVTGNWPLRSGQKILLTIIKGLVFMILYAYIVLTRSLFYRGLYMTRARTVTSSASQPAPKVPLLVVGTNPTRRYLLYYHRRI